MRGFSFVELAAVIVILGFILGLSFPMLKNFTSDSLKDTSRKFTGLFRSLYFDSLTKNRVLRLNYDLDDNSYWISVLEDKGEFVEETRLKSGRMELPDGVIFVDVDTELHGKRQEGTVFTTFYPEGWLDSTQIRLRYDERVLSILVDSATAAVEIHDGYIERAGPLF